LVHQATGKAIGANVDDCWQQAFVHVVSLWQFLYLGC
jgi:hypothetical protein